MRSLSSAGHRAAILARLDRLRPDSPRRWGRMTAPQMVCHMADIFHAVMGERAVKAPRRKLPAWRQRLLKLYALQLPIPWPHGVRTPSEVDQDRGGTPPGDFEADVARLRAACEQFARRGAASPYHYLFGNLTREEWARWGYRHLDHHLRQFGL